MLIVKAMLKSVGKCLCCVARAAGEDGGTSLPACRATAELSAGEEQCGSPPCLEKHIWVMEFTCSWGHSQPSPFSTAEYLLVGLRLLSSKSCFHCNCSNRSGHVRQSKSTRPYALCWCWGLLDASISYLQSIVLGRSAEKTESFPKHHEAMGTLGTG